MSFTIKRGATRPAYVATLLDNFGLANQGPLDLTTATSVTFAMRLQNTTGAPNLEAAMTLVSAAQGQVQYPWLPGDTDTLGIYDIEFKIVWNDSGIEYVPNGAVAPQFGTVTIVANLNET